jgi:hypothetical protein
LFMVTDPGRTPGAPAANKLAL